MLKQIAYGFERDKPKKCFSISPALYLMRWAFYRSVDHKNEHFVFHFWLKRDV